MVLITILFKTSLFTRVQSRSNVLRFLSLWSHISLLTLVKIATHPFIQIDNDCNGYPLVLDSNSYHNFYLLHLDENSSKIPWLVQSYNAFERGAVSSGAISRRAVSRGAVFRGAVFRGAYESRTVKRGACHVPHYCTWWFLIEQQSIVSLNII